MVIAEPDTQVDCVDLNEFADRYEFRRSVHRSRNPWHYYLEGSRANICPWGGNLLAMCFKKDSRRAAEALRKPWVIRARSQVGDGHEVNAVFAVQHLAKAAKLAGLYRSRSAIRPDVSLSRI